MEAQSKATGISIGGLIGITSQYDTFESAASAAQGLNAVLGGPYLNSIELLMATEDERIDILRETMKMSGASWDSLNRFERQAIASAAGISDMNEASRLFGTESEAFEEAANAVGEAETELEALNQMALATQSISDTLASVMEAFGAAIPIETVQSLVNGLGFVAQKVAAFMDSGLGKFILGLATGFKVLGPVVTGLIALFGTAGTSAAAAGFSFAAMGPGFAVVATGIGSIVAALSPLIPMLTIAAVGFAALGIGAGIGMARAGGALNRAPATAAPATAGTANRNMAGAAAGVTGARQAAQSRHAAQAASNTSNQSQGDVRLIVDRREFGRVQRGIRNEDINVGRAFT